MMLADRMVGMIGRSHNIDRPQATVQISVQFLAPVGVGDVVIGQGRVLRNTRSLMFLRGELMVADTLAIVVDGIRKKLGAA